MARTRYSAASRYTLDEGGITASRETQETVSFILHVVEDGDTIENIAHRILGDHLRWWEVVDINPQLQHSHCGNYSFLNLKPGDTIRIPS